jgi:TRAP transporter TAXI family solute receptor
MRKKGLLITGILFLTLVFSTVAFAEDIFIRIGTSSVGGGFYQIGNTIAQLGNRKMDGYNFTAVTGGSVKNSINLGKKDIELGMVQSATLMDAWNGTGSFEGKPVKELRFVTAIYPMPFHILVNTKADIESVADFKGKRIDYGPIGGGIEVNARRVFDVYGISDEDVDIQRFGRSEVSEALKTGRSEGHMWATSVPNAMVTDMVRSGNVGLIGLEEDKIREIAEKYSAYAPAVVPGGVYEGYDEDIPVVAAVGTLLTYADMDEDVVYEITKTLHENTDFLKERLNYFKNFGLEIALDGMVCPLHPGAKKYYVEQGIVKE